MVITIRETRCEASERAAAAAVARRPPPCPHVFLARAPAQNIGKISAYDHAHYPIQWPNSSAPTFLSDFKCNVKCKTVSPW